MRYFLLLFLTFLISTLSESQEVIDLEIIHKIRQEGLKNSNVKDLAFYLTDAFGPRLTNSPGHRKAGEWAVRQLKTWGLDNAMMEEWGEFGKGWEVDKCYVAMKEPYYFPFIAIPKAWTGSTNGLVSDEVILIDVTSEEDLEPYKGKLKGKIVLIRSLADTSPSFEAEAFRYTEKELDEEAKQRIGQSSRYSPERIAQYRARRALNNKITELLNEEGIALLIRGSRGKHGTFKTSGGGDAYKPEAKIPFAQLEMAPEHADLMARLIEKDIKVIVESEVKTTFYEDNLSSFNVVGDITGADKNLRSELVMLGGHLDSWHAGTGAVDNAAGCIVMMEAVRILKAIGYNPKRTIRIALWSGEEQGLYGSRNYVKNHFANKEEGILHPDYDNLSAYYNIDNGTGRIRGIYLQENDMLRPVFEQWFEPFSDMIDHPTVTIRNTSGTDHRAFDDVGLPGFQFIQDPIDYDLRTWHTNMDTYERLLIPDLQQMAVIVASFVYLTAERDEKLPRKQNPFDKEK
ncbi:MAG: M20/M25/M40 family metallo-hydrolase [Cyclobacteriaceae bacterium]|jgi:hypothetical protein